MKYSKSILVMSVGMLLALQFTGCQPPKAPDRQAEYEENFKKAQKAEGNGKVYDNDTSSYLASRGIIKSLYEIPVSSKTAGQVTEVYVTMGQRVRKGQVLVKLDDSDQLIKVKHAKAVIEQCRHKYQSILIGLGYKVEDLDTATPEHKTQARIGSNLEVAEADYDMLRAQLADYVIKSPVDGLVCAFDDFKYENVSQGQELFTIIDDRHLIVSFEVLERELMYYEIGTKVKVITMAYGSETHIATIAKISPRVDEKGMVLVGASLPYSPHLKAGMTASIKRMNQ